MNSPERRRFEFSEDNFSDAGADRSPRAAQTGKAEGGQAEMESKTKARGETVSVMKPRPLERDIQKQIVDWLTLRGLFWRRNNTGASGPMFHKGKRRFVRYSSPGAPDIYVVHRGLYIAIEVKRPGGRQSEDQIAFMDELRTRGEGIYVLAYSLEDVIKALSEVSYPELFREAVR